NVRAPVGAEPPTRSDAASAPSKPSHDSPHLTSPLTPSLFLLRDSCAAITHTNTHKHTHTRTHTHTHTHTEKERERQTLVYAHSLRMYSILMHQHFVCANDTCR